MRTEEYKRNCPECYNEFIAGRADQTFCVAKCRYDFHNRIARNKRKKIIPMDNILHRNREVLMDLCNGDAATVSRQQLLDAGFDFSYHTHSLQDANKVKYDFVYEFGISPVGSGNYNIVKHARV